MIGRAVGRYRIVAKLGEGGMGSVWKATDPLLERTLALKFLPSSLASSSQARQRFLREARSASTLHHPGIATVYDAGEADELVYIAMLLVEGPTVSALAASRPLPVGEALRIAIEAADALAHAHAHGVLHRDVTSRNIMLDRDGHAVVVDFGLALPEGHARLTLSGATLGTPAYISPEAIQGQPADHRSDLYGLGVVLYEMLTGKLPFSGERGEALLYAAVHRQPDPPSRHRPELPAALDAVVLRALAKDPAQRHQSAEELAAALRALRLPGVAVVSGAAARAAPPSPGQPKPSWALSSIETVTVDPSPPGPSPARTPPPAASTPVPLPGSLLPAPAPSLPAPQRLPSRLTTSLQSRRVQLALAAAAFALAALSVALWRSGALARFLSPSAPSFQSVAVLPLRNLSDDPDESQHLADGITQALITRFTQVLGLRVTPWVTAIRFSDISRPVQEIARELNVDAVVLGSFTRAGNVIHCTVSLVEAHSGMQFWADEYEEPLADLFTLQRRIATGAATRLKGKLTGQEEEELARPSSRSVEAYEHYLRGATAFQEGDREASDLALAFFSKAVELDPNLAEAYVGMGAVYTGRYFYGWAAGPRSLEEAETNFEQALSINPDLASARRGVVRVYWHRGRELDCLQVAKDAARSARQDVDTLMVRAEAYTLCGLPDRGAELFEKALELDPANAGARWFLAFASNWAGRYRESTETAEAYLRMFGDDPEIHTWLGASYHALGDLERARVSYEKANELFGDETNFYVLNLTGSLYNALGLPAEARQAFGRGAELARRRLAASPDNFRVRYYLAGFLAQLGDLRSARIEETHLDMNIVDRTGLVDLALSFAAGGDPTHAMELLRGALGREDNPAWVLRRENLKAYGAGSLEEAPGFEELERKFQESDRRLRAKY